MFDYRRRLPHWHPDHVPVFVTWRLWGSLPVSREKIQHSPGRAFVARDRVLDRDTRGPQWIEDGRIAGHLAETLEAGDLERSFYRLCAWVIMPNHVHLLVLPKRPLPVITRWLKGSSARRANQLLARTGQPFWQDESFDHWVRSTREFDKIRRYIEHNPVSAEFVSSAELWPWSSASWQAKPPAPPLARLS
jgi:type I restriction enzyme R subunit/putative DNA methylase